MSLESKVKVNLHIIRPYGSKCELPILLYLEGINISHNDCLLCEDDDKSQVRIWIKRSTSKYLIYVRMPFNANSSYTIWYRSFNCL